MRSVQQLSEKEKRWVWATLLTIAAAGIYGGILEPIFSGSDLGNRAIAARKLTLKKNLKSLAEYEAAREEAERLAGASGQSQDVTASLGQLEKLAGECGVSLVSIKPQVFEEEEGPRRILFDVSVTSGALGLTRFLYHLETSPLILRIKRFTVAPAPQSSGNLQCTLLVSQLAVR